VVNDVSCRQKTSQNIQMWRQRVDGATIFASKWCSPRDEQQSSGTRPV